MRLGKLSESILKRSVLIPASTKQRELLTTKKPGIDAGVLQMDGAVMVTASATEVIEDNAFELALLCCHKACNNMYAAGATPKGMQIQLMLPSFYEEGALKKLMQTIRAFCDAYQIAITGGQTDTLSSVSKAILSVTVFGSKEASFPDQSKLKKVAPGDCIVMSKYIAVEGTWKMTRFFREEMKDRFSANFLSKGDAFFDWCSVEKEAVIAKKLGVVAMHDVSRCGIFGALWELASREGLGLKVDFSAIPVKQETIEYSEVLDMNPYCMAGAGSLLMVTSKGEALVEALEAAGVPAKLIGTMTGDQNKVILNGDEVRNIDVPAQDEFDRKKQ